MGKLGRNRYKEGGGRIGPQTTRSFHEGIDYSDPEKDLNYNLKGSKGELLNSVTPKSKFRDEGTSEGPSKRSADWLKQTGKPWD